MFCARERERDEGERERRERREERGETRDERRETRDERQPTTPELEHPKQQSNTATKPHKTQKPQYKIPKPGPDCKPNHERKLSPNPMQTYTNRFCGPLFPPSPPPPSPLPPLFPPLIPRPAFVRPTQPHLPCSVLGPSSQECSDAACISQPSAWST